MRTLKRFLGGASLGLVLLACGSVTEPMSDQAPVQAMGAARGGNSGAVPTPIVVKHGAPPLATTHASFWAVQGEKTGVVISYRAPTELVAGDRFLEFTVPAKAQMVDPSGRALARGDSILIEIRVVPGQLAAVFSPEGLAFTGRNPAELRISYLHGDVVDPARQLGIWYLPCDGGPPELQSSTMNRKLNMVVSDIAHFSNYAVAYRK